MPIILMLAALAASASCGEMVSGPDSPVERNDPVVFNLTASHPDATKAVKTGWEDGDAIFVFFSNVSAPDYLKMTYGSGTGWTSAEYEGANAVPGALDLENGDGGSMRAVFLPFGSGKAMRPSRRKTSAIFL